MVGKRRQKKRSKRAGDSEPGASGGFEVGVRIGYDREHPERVCGIALPAGRVHMDAVATTSTAVHVAEPTQLSGRITHRPTSHGGFVGIRNGRAQAAGAEMSPQPSQAAQHRERSNRGSAVAFSRAAEQRCPSCDFVAFAWQTQCPRCSAPLTA